MSLESPPSEGKLDEDRPLLEEGEPLELEGREGIPAVEEEDEEGEGCPAEEEEDEEEEDEEEEGDGSPAEDGDELGIEGPDDEEDEEEELGMLGMPPLLLELCWVDSQPARISASTEALTRVAVRTPPWPGNLRIKSGVFMVASASI